MKKRYFIILVILATVIGCSEKEAGRSKGPLGVEKEGVVRPDLTPPRLSDVTVGPYYDEFLKKVINFEISKARGGIGGTHFHHYVTNWKMATADRDDQKVFFSNEKHLPYFLVTVDDIDTPQENLALYYAFERIDDEKSPLSYLVAEKYKFGKINQWFIVLSEETAGTTLNSFSGERAFSLHLKAVDARGHETKGVFPFFVTNLQPSLKVYKDPNYNDSRSYPEALSNFVFWKKGDFEKNLMLLRQGESLPTSSPFSLFLVKFVLENDQPFEMRVKVGFQKGRLDYSFERRFEKREGRELEVVKLYAKSWSHAPLQMYEYLAGRAQYEGEKQGVYRLPPADLSLGEEGLSRLYLYFASDFKFKNSHPEESISRQDISANLFIDRIALNGDVIVHSAPAGLPLSYYEKESNWLNQSGRLDVEHSLISNK